MNEFEPDAFMNWMRDHLKMKPAITFRVYGLPAPGGSKIPWVPKDKATGQPKRRANGSIIIHTFDDANRRTADGRQPNKEWRAAVASAAVEAATKAAAGSVAAGLLFPGPLIFVATFIMERRKGDFGSGKNAGNLKPSAPVHHTKAPDALKLMRSTEDALTGVLWIDDAQIVASIPIKRYANPGEPTGAQLEIYAL